MKKYYSIAVLMTLALMSAAQFTWTIKDTFPGTPRRMAAGLNINGAGYLVGGNTASPATYVNDVWEYTPSTDSWAQKANFPYNVATPAYFTINNVGYVVGGSQAAGVCVSTNEMYNAALDTWTAKASFPENGVTEPFQFVVNGIAYVGAGARNGSSISSTMYAYDPVTDSWTSKASYPGPQGINMAGFSIDSFGYAGLGQDGAGAFYTQFYKYYPGSDSWTQIASFPGKKRSATTYFVLNGKAYVGGGVTLVGGSPYSLGDFYEYDPSTNKWAPVPGFPGPARQYATPIVFNDVAYSFCGYDDDGGYDNDGSPYYNFVNEFGTCGVISSILPMPDGNTKSGIEVYPNPTGTGVNVKIDNAVNNELNYEVVSVDGKVVKTGVTRQSTFGFNAGNLADGIYILTIRNGQQLQGEQKFEVIH